MTSSQAAKLAWLRSSLHFPAPTVRGPRGRSSGSKWRVRRSESELWSTAELESALVGSSGVALVRKDLVFEPLSEDSQRLWCQKLLKFIDSLGNCRGAIATKKALLRGLKLLALGLFLQGGFFHGIKELTFGVDIAKMRWMGILQRIAIGYLVVALCEIWLKGDGTVSSGSSLLRKYKLQLVMALMITVTYLLLMAIVNYLLGCMVCITVTSLTILRSSEQSSALDYVIHVCRSLGLALDLYDMHINKALYTFSGTCVWQLVGDLAFFFFLCGFCVVFHFDCVLWN